VAVQVLWDMFPKDGKIVNIDMFITKLIDYGLRDTQDRFRTNLKILLTQESRNDTNIVFESLSAFLARFGPISKLKFKINCFIAQGARNWYHGHLDASKAEDILLKFPGNCYLLRNASTLEITEIPQLGKILSVFTLSWRSGTLCQHMRIHVNESGEHCFRVQGGNCIRTIRSWEGMWKIVAQDFSLTDNFSPISGEGYSGLAQERYIDLANIETEEEKHLVAKKPTDFGFVSQKK